MSFLRVAQVALGLRAGVLGASDGRMGVWTQGCSLPKCPGCTSAHTWPAAAGRDVPVAGLLRLAQSRPVAPAGLTVSGGEPSDQAAPVAALIAGFRSLWPQAEVVLYSGLRWTVLARRHPDLVALLDVAVTGPFVAGRAATPMAGSNNQEVRLLTPLAERLYRSWENWPRHAVQVAASGPSRVVTVGIPDTPRLARAARTVGAAGVSWITGNAENEP